MRQACFVQKADNNKYRNERPFFMPKRVTIMLSDDLDTFVRRHQANTIRDTQKGYSYSQALNDLLSNGI